MTILDKRYRVVFDLHEEHHEAKKLRRVIGRTDKREEVITPEMTSGEFDPVFIQFGGVHVKKGGRVDIVFAHRLHLFGPIIAIEYAYDSPDGTVVEGLTEHFLLEELSHAEN